MSAAAADPHRQAAQHERPAAGTRRRRGAGTPGRYLAVALALLMVAAPLLAQAPIDDQAVQREDARTRFDAMLVLAEESPARAQAALGLAGAADAAQPGTPPPGRDDALLRAWVAVRADLAEAGRAPQWDRLWADLATASAAVSPRLADADSQLLRALLADREGRPGAETLAQQALSGYESHCGQQRPLRPDCEIRGRWQARQLLAQLADRRQAADAARIQAQAALDLAVAGRDTRRQAWSECQLALNASHAGQHERAGAHLVRARALAGRRADLTLQQRLAITEATLARSRGDARQAGQALQHLVALAMRTQSPRQQASALANLSDHAVMTGDARRGLQAAERGLALLGADAQPSLRRVLLNNAVLARVALGRADEARRDFETLQAAWGAAGEGGRQLTSLREFGDALAAAGDLKGALDMHHREQSLAARLTEANREAALAELRTRFDREAQQRRILLLERNNALTATAVANQALDQRLWAAAGGVLALAALLMLLLVRRVRDTRRRLQDHQARLRVQSERDALTGVASRRHALVRLRAAGQSAGGFSGALLMIDIDHFKQINDHHGHGVGDQVLAETARRIAAEMGPQDLVARWGGEEFLVHAPGLQPAEGEALAQRLLLAVAGTPVAVADAAPLRVTASLGHAVFPLAPHRLPLTPEQAINLADMALYTAKSQGRHRATGICGCTAADAGALQAVEADFERAWQDGRVSLHTDVGPGPALDSAAGQPAPAGKVVPAARPDPPDPSGPPSRTAGAH